MRLASRISISFIEPPAHGSGDVCRSIVVNSVPSLVRNRTEASGSSKHSLVSTAPLKAFANIFGKVA